MNDPTYSIKEIIELQFINLSKEMTEIKQLLKEQNVQVDKRFATIEREIKDVRDDIDGLKIENSRYKLIFTVVGTLGASLFAFGLNKVF